MNLRQCAGWLAGLWAGEIVCVGALAAPTAFATLARADAGRFVGRVFEQDAYLGLAMGGLLLLLERRLNRAGGPMFSVNVMLLFGAVFCVVAGYFAVLPLMAQARAGQGGASFMALHMVSTAFFAGKGLMVAVLAWRYAGRGPA
jgi:hypothetical protein